RSRRRGPVRRGAGRHGRGDHHHDHDDHHDPRHRPGRLGGRGPLPLRPAVPNAAVRVGAGRPLGSAVAAATTRQRAGAGGPGRGKASQMSNRIAVVGTGYVGLTTGTCLAHLGHDVTCIDNDPAKIELLESGGIPILEPGLPELAAEGVAAGRLRFTGDIVEGVQGREFVLLCVPTPQGSDGSADLSYIESAARSIRDHLEPNAIVINKSTVPVGSTRVVANALGREDVHVVSNPEFLREGSAVSDFLNPERVVIGADDQAVAIRVAALHLRLAAPLLVTDPATAELTKYASNAFLALKISYINAIAAVAEAVGADIDDVVTGLGLDSRIGQSFLRPGPGWGGSC